MKEHIYENFYKNGVFAYGACAYVRAFFGLRQ